MPAADHCNFRADFLRTVRKLGLIGLRSLRVKESRKAWSGDRETDNRVLASAVLLDHLAALPLGVTQRRLGTLEMRGKERALELHVLEASG